VTAIKIINFGHPFTEEQLNQLADLMGKEIKVIHQATVHFLTGSEFVPQAEALIEELPLSSEQWQTERLLINLPSLSVIAALLLAGMHGRMGYFPPVIRLRPREGTTPPVFDVAEVLDLNQVREAARKRRISE